LEKIYFTVLPAFYHPYFALIASLVITLLTLPRFI